MTPEPSEAAAREALVTHARELHRRGLAPGTSGNLSLRLGERLLITPTNTSLGRLDPVDLALVDVDGVRLPGPMPSKELGLHLLMYRARPGTRAVAHLHSTHAVAVSCLQGLDPSCALPLLTPYFVLRVGAVALVPYFRPGHPDLVAAATPLAAAHRALLLANHGPIVGGSDLDAAVHAMEELEETARLSFLLHGRSVQTLSAASVAELSQSSAT